MRPGGRENWPIKIIETSGKTLESVLVKADPFLGNKCVDSKSLPNKNPPKKLVVEKTMWDVRFLASYALQHI